MKPRIIVCCTSELPNGDANAHYVYNMCKALAHTGAEVIAIGKTEKGDRTEKISDSIKIINISFKKKYVPLRIKGAFCFGNEVLKELEKLNITENDYFVLYSGYESVFKVVKNKYKFLPKNHVTTCVVEWPMKEQYSHAQINPIYILWHRVFYKFTPFWGKVIPISKNLERHFKAEGCDTFILPPLIDSTDYDMPENIDLGEKCKFIYSGAFSKKDAMENMLMSVEKLTDEERKKFEFHITGNKKEALEAFLDEKSDILNKYAENILIHGRLPYDELLALYADSDYLLLARPENQYTISNFPSKVPEMMNYGIIPVCSNVGDYTNLYLEDGKNSLVFEGCSVDDCANAIRRALNLSNEQRQAMRLNAKKNSAQMFDYRMWGEKLSEFIFK